MANTAPVVAISLEDKPATQDELFNFAIPVGSFTDADNDILTYSATLANGDALPTWLTFDAATQTFSGTPGANDIASLEVKVIANDGLASADDVFILAVGAAPQPPVLELPLVDTMATEGQAFSFVIPTGSFTDADTPVLTYTATLVNGDPLPTWLVFDAATQTFSGTPGANDIANLEVKVIASDDSAFAEDVFALAVAGGSTPVPPTPETPITIQNAVDGIWNVNGAGKVKVSVSGNTTNKFNEVGYFKLDANNKVNGFAVGDEGFAKAVLQSGRVVFSILPDRITDGLDLSRSFQVADGEKLGFFTIAGGTVEGNLSSNNFSNVTTSVDAIKPFAVTQNPGGYTLALTGDNNLSFNFQVDNTAPSVVDTISSQQGNKEGEMFDFTQLAAGQKVEATFTIKREAGYDSSVSFYKIDDAAGTVTSGNKQFRPGEAGYIEAALANSVAGLKLAGKNGETVTVSQMMEGGSMYAPILTSNVTSSNPSGEIYTAFSVGNTDRTDHVRLLGDNTFGFEDLYNGGDKDFNDVIVQATFKVV